MKKIERLRKPISDTKIFPRVGRRVRGIVHAWNNAGDNYFKSEKFKEEEKQDIQILQSAPKKPALQTQLFATHLPRPKPLEQSKGQLAIID